jgi:predicted nucleic acid-binding protein
VTYLLDVSALVALGFIEHEFNDRVVSWLLSEPKPVLATCAITELGFLRVLGQASAYGLSIADGKTLLARLKRSGSVPFLFISDDHDVAQLPDWVKTPRQTTDGHLLKLANAHDATLATLDAGILGAYLIPR